MDEKRHHQKQRQVQASYLVTDPDNVVRASFGHAQKLKIGVFKRLVKLRNAKGRGSPERALPSREMIKVVNSSFRDLDLDSQWLESGDLIESGSHVTDREFSFNTWTERDLWDSQMAFNTRDILHTAANVSPSTHNNPRRYKAIINSMKSIKQRIIHARNPQALRNQSPTFQTARHKSQRGSLPHHHRATGPVSHMTRSMTADIGELSSRPVCSKLTDERVKPPSLSRMVSNPPEAAFRKRSLHHLFRRHSQKLASQISTHSLSKKYLRQVKTVPTATQPSNESFARSSSQSSQDGIISDSARSHEASAAEQKGPNAGWGRRLGPIVEPGSLAGQSKASSETCVAVDDLQDIISVAAGGHGGTRASFDLNAEHVVKKDGQGVGGDKESNGANNSNNDISNSSSKAAQQQPQTNGDGSGFEGGNDVTNCDDQKQLDEQQQETQVKMVHRELDLSTIKSIRETKQISMQSKLKGKGIAYDAPTQTSMSKARGSTFQRTHAYSSSITRSIPGNPKTSKPTQPKTSPFSTREAAGVGQEWQQAAGHSGSTVGGPPLAKNASPSLSRRSEAHLNGGVQRSSAHVQSKQQQQQQDQEQDQEQKEQEEGTPKNGASGGTVAVKRSGRGGAGRSLGRSETTPPSRIVETTYENTNEECDASLDSRYDVISLPDIPRMDAATRQLYTQPLPKISPRDRHHRKLRRRSAHRHRHAHDIKGKERASLQLSTKSSSSASFGHGAACNDGPCQDSDSMDPLDSGLADIAHQKEPSLLFQSLPMTRGPRYKLNVQGSRYGQYRYARYAHPNRASGFLHQREWLANVQASVQQGRGAVQDVQPDPNGLEGEQKGGVGQVGGGAGASLFGSSNGSVSKSLLGSYPALKLSHSNSNIRAAMASRSRSRQSRSSMRSCSQLHASSSDLLGTQISENSVTEYGMHNPSLHNTNAQLLSELCASVSSDNESEKVELPEPNVQKKKMGWLKKRSEPAVEKMTVEERLDYFKLL